MQDAWVSALSFILVAVAVAGSMLVLARLFRVRARAHSGLELRTYESGEEPTGVAWIQFHPRYYVVALFFVLFDVEAAFLLPWGVVLRTVGTSGLIAALGFIGVLLLGWIYAVRRRALEWQ